MLTICPHQRGLRLSRGRLRCAAKYDGSINEHIRLRTILQATIPDFVARLHSNPEKAMRRAVKIVSTLDHRLFLELMDVASASVPCIVFRDVPFTLLEVFISASTRDPERRRRVIRNPPSLPCPYPVLRALRVM